MNKEYTVLTMQYLEADAVIITTPPKEACKMIKGAEGTSLQRWSEQSVPVTVAALDIGLRRLPNPTHQFALGLDQLYFLRINQEQLN